MPCYRPIEVGVRRKSLYGRGTRDLITVPCGNCIGCRMEQARQWAVRMMHESRGHDKNIFLTLTYDDRHLNANSELCARDFSGFIRALRKKQKGRFSFYGCGEYGERTARPHYHALLFGYDVLDRDSGFDSSRPEVWRSKTLADTWGRGMVEGGSVTMASASYCSGYMRKKVKASRYERADIMTGELKTPEFARMSLRPAIGLRWIKKWWSDVYPRDFIVMNGFEAKPPRYYDRFMDREDDKGGSHKKRAIMEDVRQMRRDLSVEPTRYQLAAGEKIAESRINLFGGRDAV